MSEPFEPSDPRDEALVALYRRLPRPEPPPALDLAVLAQARSAVRRPRQRWLAPVSAAAVVVLAVGVAWQWRAQSLDGGPASPLPPLPPSAASPQPADAMKSAVPGAAAERGVDENRARSGPVDAPPVPAASADASTAAGRGAAADTSVPSEIATRAEPPAPAQATTRQRLREQVPDVAPEASPAEVQDAAPAPVPAPAAPPAEPAPLVIGESEWRADDGARTETAPAPPAPAAAPEAVPKAVGARASEARRMASPPPERDVAADEPPRPGEPAPPAASPAPVEETLPTQAAPIPQAPEAGTTATLGGTRNATAAVDRRTPEAWIESIRALRDAGDRDAARAELTALRRAFPALELPEDLRPLLPD
jgi:Meckel syndrome type 1 protein